MHTLREQNYPDHIVKYKIYLKCFQKTFSLLFGRKQTDVCGLCEELIIKLKNPHTNDNAKRVKEVLRSIKEKQINITKIYRKWKLRPRTIQMCIGLHLILCNACRFHIYLFRKFFIYVNYGYMSYAYKILKRVNQNFILNLKKLLTMVPMKYVLLCWIILKIYWQ